MAILNVTTSAIGEDAGQGSQTASMMMIAELTTSIVARCCSTQEEQTILSQRGIINPLVALLHSGYAKVVCHVYLWAWCSVLEIKCGNKSPMLIANFYNPNRHKRPLWMLFHHFAAKTLIFQGLH